MELLNFWTKKAFECTNKSVKGGGLFFHELRFSNEALLVRWIQRVKRKQWIPSKCSVLCTNIFFKKISTQIRAENS